MTEECAKHDGRDCKCVSQSAVYGQTLTELDFTRGIWTAAMDGELQKVASTLNKGTDPDVTDSAGYTALHYASSNGHTDICELLLSNKANPNARTRSGNDTPLHRAAYRGHENVVKLLVKHGGNPRLCNTDGQTPLHKAAERGHKDIVNLFIKSNPDLVNFRDNRSRKALDMVPKDRSDIRNILLS